MKSIFLLRQRLGFEAARYDFFPYRFGPFSNEIYRDLSFLEKEGFFRETEMNLTKRGAETLSVLPKNEKMKNCLEQITKDFSGVRAIKNFVYEKYPEFTIRSNCPKKIISNKKGVCTIGYEGKTMDGFLNLLIQKNVSLVIDVRKNAFSMKRGFSKTPLKKSLEMGGINYIHFPDLGIPPSKRTDLNSSESYQELFKEYSKSLSSKKERIEEIRCLGNQQKIALLCFEADPAYCHRGILSEIVSDRTVHL